MESPKSDAGMPEDFSIDAEADEQGQHDTHELEERQRCPGCTPKNLEKKRRTIFVSCALVLAGAVLLIVGAVLVAETGQFSAGVALVVIGGKGASVHAGFCSQLFSLSSNLLSSWSVHGIHSHPSIPRQTWLVH